MRVLIFDDDEAIGRLVVRVATASGLEATAVSDADAFKQGLQTDPPQVIVLDLQLAGTDGVEQMRLLASQQYTGALVLMSGYDTRVLATAQSVGKNLGLKVDRVLEKPLNVAELGEVLERLLLASQTLSPERLLTAIANDELILDFQPIVSRQPKTLKKLEALVRWEHPVLGWIPPDRFLPAAESDTATIDALTDWVVGATVDAYQVLAELGVSVPLAVNVSVCNLHDLTLPDRIDQRLRAGGMTAQHLCLEITESAAFTDVARTMDILSRVRLKGMLLSIDDFGTGYSSLKMLRQMPFSEIKIDQSFVRDVTTSRDSRAIVKSIIGLAANMEMTCVAEGVETEETADLLEELGLCNLQGYLIARPMPVEAVSAWLAIWTGSTLPAPATRPTGNPAAMRGHGEVFHTPSVPSPTGTESDVVQLSPRQLEVMQLLSEGCPVKEIAYRLNLGIGTVKVHLSLAYSALGAHNRIEAIKRAGPALLGRQIKQGPIG
jgi:EAL domain-containing protein (putative c-di-GMP-specific phosphodiesterase class I)/DNA-binding CsgD family transcriptional regulator